MSEIKKLAVVIAFSMGNKKKTPEEVANLCMCAASLVTAWLAGTAVPDRQRWGFLCSRLDRSLFTYGSLHIAALAELAAPVVPPVGAGLLGAKLTEALKPIAGASGASMLAKAAVAAGTAEALLAAPQVAPESKPGVLADMKALIKDPEVARREARSAQTSKALLALPAGWRSRENIARREAFARNYFRTKPHANLAECAEALDAEFKVGIGSTSLSRIRDEERRMIEAGQRPPTLVAEVPAIPEPVREQIVDVAGPTVDDQLQVALEIILEAIPHLAEMVITRSPEGEVSYKVREAKVVETSGRVVRPR